MQIMNIGTLNTQGCQDNTKLLSIASDSEKYNVQILGLTETHIVDQHLEEIKGIKNVFNLYHNGIKGSNKYSGVGILIDKDISATFRRISDRNMCSRDRSCRKGEIICYSSVCPHLRSIREESKYKGRILSNIKSSKCRSSKEQIYVSNFR